MSNLVKRVLVAIVLLPPVIWAFVVGGVALKAICVFVAVLGFWEYGNIVAKEDRLARLALILVGGVSTALSLVVGDPVRALLIPQMAAVLLACLFVLRPGDMPTAWRRMTTLSFGVVYIGLGIASIARLRDMGDALQGASQGGYVLAAFTATWANDTCAYFTGRAIGKHKMAEAISPKKTWEGFAGGAVGALLFLLAGRAAFPTVFAEVTVIDIVMVGLPTAFLGPMGDLAESMLKRNYDIKDSSNLIPGHGGVLDRIDAIFFVTPWTLCYFAAIKPWMSM